MPVKKFSNIFSRLDTVPERDRQTDRQIFLPTLCCALHEVAQCNEVGLIVCCIAVLHWVKCLCV